MAEMEPSISTAKNVSGAPCLCSNRFLDETNIQDVDQVDL